jgi:ribosome-associated toxin RatA of RatAB toxin-antitoxin module
VPGATQSILINAVPDKVFDTITDYPHYGDFLSEVRGVKVLSRKGTEADVQFEVNVVKNIRYTLRMKEERPLRLAWTFMEGEIMKDNKGEWRLEAVGEKQTRATYTIEMALGAFVPKSLVNALVETSLPKMLEGFKKASEAR